MNGIAVEFQVTSIFIIFFNSSVAVWGIIVHYFEGKSCWYGENCDTIMQKYQTWCQPITFFTKFCVGLVVYWPLYKGYGLLETSKSDTHDIEDNWETKRMHCIIFLTFKAHVKTVDLRWWLTMIVLMLFRQNLKCQQCVYSSFNVKRY